MGTSQRTATTHEGCVDAATCTYICHRENLKATATSGGSERSYANNGDTQLSIGLSIDSAAVNVEDH